MSSLTDRACHTLLVGGLLAALVVVAPAAQAVPDAFQSSYAEGKAALQRGAFLEALDHFRQSLRDAGEHQAASWKGMIGVAYAFRGLEEPGYALEYYRRFLDESAIHMKMLPPKWRARHEAVRAEVGELENQALESHALVSLASSPPGARLTVDGLAAGADGTALTPYPLYLAPGKHVLVLSLDGHADVTRTFTVSAGELVPVSVTLNPGTSPPRATPITPPPVAKPTAPAKAATKTKPSPKPVVKTAPVEAPLVVPAVEEAAEVGVGPYVLLGAGGAAALAAIGLSVGAEMKNQELEDLERHFNDLSKADRKALTGDDADKAIEMLEGFAASRDTLQLASAIGFAVGFASVIGGVIWLLAVEPDESGDTSTAARLVPVFGFAPTDGGGMTSATWRF